MKRDIIRAFEYGIALIEKNESLDLSAFDVMRIIKRVDSDSVSVSEATLNLITTSYYAGLAIGTRNGHR